MSQSIKSYILVGVVLVVFLYYFSPAFRYDANQAMDTVEEQINSLGSTEVGSVQNNLSKYHNTTITVQGSISNAVVSGQSLGPSVQKISDGTGSVFVKGCDTLQEPPFTVRVERYLACECQYGQYGDSSTGAVEKCDGLYQCQSDTRRYEPLLVCKSQ